MQKCADYFFIEAILTCSICFGVNGKKQNEQLQTSKHTDIVNNQPIVSYIELFDSK